MKTDVDLLLKKTPFRSTLILILTGFSLLYLLFLLSFNFATYPEQSPLILKEYLIASFLKVTLLSLLLYCYTLINEDQSEEYSKADISRFNVSINIFLIAYTIALLIDIIQLTIFKRINPEYQILNFVFVTILNGELVEGFVFQWSDVAFFPTAWFILKKSNFIKQFRPAYFMVFILGVLLLTKLALIILPALEKYVENR